MLWFDALGYSDRFWTTVFAQFGFAACGALLGGLWGLGNWQVILQHVHRVSTGIDDPIFRRDIGFYF